MFDNNFYGFNYDDEAIILEYNPNTPVKKEVKTVAIREYAEWQQDASFAGGIANLGVVYAVATNEKIDISKIKPYKNQMVIDGIEYKILIIKQQHTNIGGLNNYKEKEKETVFFLG